MRGAGDNAFFIRRCLEVAFFAHVRRGPGKEGLHYRLFVVRVPGSGVLFGSRMALPSPPDSILLGVQSLGGLGRGVGGGGALCVVRSPPPFLRMV